MDWAVRFLIVCCTGLLIWRNSDSAKDDLTSVLLSVYLDGTKSQDDLCSRIYNDIAQEWETTSK